MSGVLRPWPGARAVSSRSPFVHLSAPSKRERARSHRATKRKRSPPFTRRGRFSETSANAAVARAMGAIPSALPGSRMSDAVAGGQW
jgi:hypothetical protein